MASQLAAALLGFTDYGKVFWDSIDKAMSEALKGSDGWNVHHIYQQADGLREFLRDFKPVNGKTGVFDVDDLDNLAAVPKFVHDEITQHQGDWWRARWKAIVEADKTGSLKLSDYSIQNVIKHTKDKQGLLNDYENLVEGLNKQYSKYFIKHKATLKELNDMLAEFGKKPARSIKDANKAILSKKSQTAFKFGENLRKKNLARSLTQGMKKLANPGLAGKIVKRGATSIGLVGLLVFAAKLKGSQESDEFKELIHQYEISMEFEEEHGYPKKVLVQNTLNAFDDYVKSIDADSDNYNSFRAYWGAYVDSLPDE
jgi:hypothetical protein